MSTRMNEMMFRWRDSRPLRRIISRATAAVTCTAAPLAFALTVSPTPTIDFDVNGCSEIANDAFVFTIDRDTSGTGEETVEGEVRDGAGTLLFSFLIGPVSVPDTLNADPNSSLYTAVPAFNPLTLTIVSPGGNGLPDQVAVNVSGNCAGLPPFATQTSVPTLPAVALGLLIAALVGFGAAFARRGRPH